MVIFYHCGSKYEILDQPYHRKFHSNGWFKTVAMVFSLKRVNMHKSGFCQKFSKYVNYENLYTLAQCRTRLDTIYEFLKLG